MSTATLDRPVAGRGGTPRPRRRTALPARLAVGVALLATWWLAAHLHVLSAEILPTPWAVLSSFVTLALSGAFWASFGYTLLTAMSGLLLGIVVGVPLGLVLGLLPRVERATRFLLDLGRSFPVIALLPVMILLLGATPTMEVVVIFLGVVWPILLQTIYGSRRLDPVVRDTMSSYRITTRLRFAKVLLPAALPFTATGVRVAASVSILLAMGVELLGKTPGMGMRVVTAQTDGRPELALAYVAFAGLLGVTVNALLARLEHRYIVWNARADRGEDGR